MKRLNRWGRTLPFPILFAASLMAASPNARLVDAVVAAPILDRHGAVIGALYGDRRQERGADPLQRRDSFHRAWE